MWSALLKEYRDDVQAMKANANHVPSFRWFAQVHALWSDDAGSHFNTLDVGLSVDKNESDTEAAEKNVQPQEKKDDDVIDLDEKASSYNEKPPSTSKVLPPSPKDIQKSPSSPLPKKRIGSTQVDFTEHMISMRDVARENASTFKDTANTFKDTANTFKELLAVFKQLVPSVPQPNIAPAPAAVEENVIDSEENLMNENE